MPYHLRLVAGGKIRTEPNLFLEQKAIVTTREMPVSEFWHSNLDVIVLYNSALENEVVWMKETIFAKIHFLNRQRRRRQRDTDARQFLFFMANIAKCSLVDICFSSSTDDIRTKWLFSTVILESIFEGFSCDNLFSICVVTGLVCR